MAIRYVRVRDKKTKHEFDVLVERVDQKKHEIVDATPRSRPLPAKPFRSKGGESATPKRKHSSRTKREVLVAAAEEAGLTVTDDLTNKQLADALNERYDSDPQPADDPTEIADGDQ